MQVVDVKGAEGERGTEQRRLEVDDGGVARVRAGTAQQAVGSAVRALQLGGREQVGHPLHQRELARRCADKVGTG